MGVHIRGALHKLLHVHMELYMVTRVYIELYQFRQQIQFVFRILTINPSSENDAFKFGGAVESVAHKWAGP